MKKHFKERVIFYSKLLKFLIMKRYLIGRIKYYLHFWLVIIVDFILNINFSASLYFSLFSLIKYYIYNILMYNTCNNKIIW